MSSSSVSGRAVTPVGAPSIPAPRWVGQSCRVVASPGWVGDGLVGRRNAYQSVETMRRPYCGTGFQSMQARVENPCHTSSTHRYPRSVPHPSPRTSDSVSNARRAKDGAHSSHRRRRPRFADVSSSSVSGRAVTPPGEVFDVRQPLAGLDQAG